MSQLTALDAQFLSAESATTAAHVAGVAVLDPSCAPSGTITRERLAALLLERMHLSPALSLRVAEVPFGLDRPYWAPDPAFSIDHHLFETELDAPGGDRQLAETVARLHARHLDRDHPLWEMHLITGLSGGRVAVYTKVHHAAIDGVSGAETLATLLDLSPEPRSVAPPSCPPPQPPHLLDMLAGAAVRTVTQPVQAMRSLVRAAGDLDAIPVVATLPGSKLIARAARLVSGDERPRPDLPSLAVPRTPLNGPISGERRFAYGSVPLKEVKHAAKCYGMSVNDIVMALCASALRAWLDERDALPDQPLIAAVPVAVRAAGAKDCARNQISTMIIPMPTHVADTRERLRATAEATSAAKRRFAMSPATWLHELCAMLPAPISALTPAVFRLASVAFPPINLIISNVPGPQFPLYLCGGRVLSYYPMSVLTDLSGGVNITCFSYDGALDFGVVACPEHVDDVWRLMHHLRAAMDDLTLLTRDLAPV
ncbi:WS/DGAT/MGAT family O-acyltransferase [Nonomuraea africana]|uniref:Diacylglycerol O-acyltransferase n=1 Tax=Nonomuraea africana TaxID=46171 RepID=A0ABR9K9M6_9ACTN|nr:wax ester/triacylglycerol synthase family O-acyltransferase [Nonomuraea africana]MBE1558719.1 WS/DGAT/MGAT family acyltransferase [Nonomuraea africana]